MCRLQFFVVVGLALVVAGAAGAQRLGQGNVLLEYWWDGGISGTIASLEEHSEYLRGRPGASEWRKSLDRPDLPYTNYYGVRARGYLIPPETGAYTFWLYGNDEVKLYVRGQNDQQPIEVNLSVIGDWTRPGRTVWERYPSRMVEGVPLVARQRYYFDIRYVDGEGAGAFGVGWAGPGISDGPVIIDGKYLAPFIRERDPLLVAHNPTPANGSVGIAPSSLQWESRVTGILHDVYLGISFSDVNDASREDMRGVLVSQDQSANSYEFEEPLESGRTYHWRVDEVIPGETIVRGSVWSFTVRPEIPWDPFPRNGDQSVNLNADLTWDSVGESSFYTVYFGEEYHAVEGGIVDSLTTDDPSYDPGLLQPNRTYYWRVDEFVQGELRQGEVWTFTTADPFVFVFDDFEDYDNPTDRWEVAGGGQVGHPAGDGSRVMETRLEYVYGGAQSMPLYYNNPGPLDYSQADYHIPEPYLDLTIGGRVNAYRLHIRGTEGNDPARFYVAVTDSGGASAEVYHPDHEVAATTRWQKWTIPLSKFERSSDGKRVNLEAIAKISIGVGTFGGFVTARNDAVSIASGSQGVVDCDDAEGTGGLLPVFVDGFVRDMFSGKRVTKQSNCIVTLRHLDSLEEEDSDDTNSLGHYFLEPDPGTYWASVTADGFPDLAAHTVQVKLCCDGRRDFLLQRGNAPEGSVYRFLSPSFLSKSNWFCTASIFEMIEHLRSDDWTYNGIAFCSAVTGTHNPKPVRRFRSKFKGTFFYTVDQAKTKTFTDDDNEIVWEFEEEEAFQVYSEDERPGDAKAVHDYWSPSSECHFYTLSESTDPGTWANAEEWVESGIIPWWTEVNDWSYEGIAWYATVPTPE